MPNHDTRILPTTKVRESHHPWENRIKDEYYHTYKYGHNSVNNPIYPPPKEDDKTEKEIQEPRTKFTVIGNRVTKEFIYCLYLVKGLYQYRKKHFEAPIITGVTGVEWPKVWNDLKIRFGELAYTLQSQVAVLKNGQFLGGEDELTQFVETKYVYHLYLDYNKEGIQQFTNYIKSYGRPCAYLLISINEEPVGSLIFMLYSDIAPLTCQNFLQMCEKVKGGYGGTPIHRIVKDCWIQCGGYDLKSSVNLVCENFIVPHDRRGVLCMANDGRNVDCSTQFFVLLQPASWMEKKYVAFGQLIDGEKTLSRIENVSTWYESPTSDIKIDKAGILNLDCPRIPINKNITAYIQGHIDDLITIGQTFYEALLENVFLEIELRIAKAHEHIQEILSAGDSGILKTESYLDTSSEGEGEEDDIDTLNTGEKESRDVKPSSTESNSDIPMQPEEPFYLPLTDVPYPGEVDSVYNLEKFIKGDYCLESDLEKLPKKPHLYGNGSKPVPEELIGQLFDYLIDDTDYTPADETTDLNLHTTVSKAYRDELDKVSLAGPIVKKMALEQLSHKDLLKGNIDEVLSDETLRMIRVVAKNSKRSFDHKICIKLPDGLPTKHAKIRRRLTGIIPPPNVVKGTGADEEDEMEVEVEVKKEPDEKIDVVVNDPQEPSLQPSLSNEFTSLALRRMFEDVAADNKPHSSTHTFQNYTPSELCPTSILIKKDDNTERIHHHDVYENKHAHIISYTPSLPSDKFISNHDTKNKFGFGEKLMRSEVHSKKRPSLTISEYQMKNRKYWEDLKLQQSSNNR